MSKIGHFLATSHHPIARAARAVRRGLLEFHLPAPRLIVRPLLWCWIALRFIWHFWLRVLICEPLFKAYCKSYGRDLQCGVFLHWVQGQGDIIIGDHVRLHGKSTFIFSSRFSARPLLRIGDHCHVGHNSTFVVARSVTVGSHVLIAPGVRIIESNGHSLDPAKRLAGLPPDADEVLPVTIGNNVWIGGDAVILPGVTVGDNSVIATHSVVTRDVPANCVVAGCPAKVIRELTPPEAPA